MVAAAASVCVCVCCLCGCIVLPFAGAKTRQEQVFFPTQRKQVEGGGGDHAVLFFFPPGLLSVLEALHRLSLLQALCFSEALDRLICLE